MTEPHLSEEDEQWRRTLGPEFAGRRLDHALSELFPQYSRSRLQRWLKEAKITVNGHSAIAKQKVSGGEVINLSPIVTPDERLVAQPIDVDVRFEDEHLLVLNKPAGLVVHPGAGNPDGTLVNALVNHCTDLAKIPRAGIIHRLDKDTSGLLIVAKTLIAHGTLTKLLKDKMVSREYVAIVQGRVTGGGSIDAPIGRHPTQRTRMAIRSGERRAVTHYRVIKRFTHHSLLRFQLETGRTHQIRVHASHIGHAIIGDPLYSRLRIPGGAEESLRAGLQGLRRQMLHAERLAFRHPNTDDELLIEAPPPVDFSEMLRLLELHD